MFSTRTKRRIVAICSMMLTLVLVFGTAVPVYAASAVDVAGKSQTGSSSTYILWVAVIVLLLLCICLIYCLRKQITGRAQDDAVAKERQRRLGKLNKETAHNLKLAEQEILDLEEWQKRAITAQPTIQMLINDQISKEKAEKFAADFLQTNTEDMKVPEAYDTYDRIFTGYEILDPDVKKHVTCDMTALRESFSEVKQRYISDSVVYLRTVNSSRFGKVDDLEELDRAIAYYEELPYEIQKAIPQRLVSSLKLKVASAEMHLPMDEPTGRARRVARIENPESDDNDE